MKNYIRIIKFAAIIPVVAALLLSGGCKGRTADNMEPTGDTVEVDVKVLTPEKSVENENIEDLN